MRFRPVYLGVNERVSLFIHEAEECWTQGHEYTIEWKNGVNDDLVARLIDWALGVIDSLEPFRVGNYLLRPDSYCEQTPIVFVPAVGEASATSHGLGRETSEFIVGKCELTDASCPLTFGESLELYSERGK